MKPRIILFLVALVLVAWWLWPTSDYKIDSIKDGNIVILNNGTEVRLIGITATEEGKSYLYDNFQGRKITLIPDGSAAFNPANLKGNEIVYSYVYSSDGGLCINEAMLREGVAGIQEGAYLNDKLKAFRVAAQEGQGHNPRSLTPTPPTIINYSEDDIKLPTYTMPQERRHSNWYTDGNMNLDMLDEACDYDLPYTKSFANQLAARSEGPFNPGQICEIFDYCFKKWRYVNDPKGHEYVARASESIASYLTGDCDDFAILMASCLLAVGADVCVNTGWNKSGEGHAFCEVDISRFNKSVVLDIIRERFTQYDISLLNVRNDANHVWLNLDWQAAYPGGPYFDCSNGRSAYPCVDAKWSWKKLR